VNNLLKYTNGTGHLIMSVLMVIAGLVLVALPWLGAGMHALGIGMIVGVWGAWFGTSSAKSVIKAVAESPITSDQTGAGLKEKAGLE
jgi:hypothetical protein